VKSPTVDLEVSRVQQSGSGYLVALESSAALERGEEVRGRDDQFASGEWWRRKCLELNDDEMGLEKTLEGIAYPDGSTSSSPVARAK
jgi:hypothetical protein